MNAAVVRSYDAPPSYTTFEEPVPSEREVLVTVTAAGLHPIVKSLANGTHYGSTGVFPFVPGVDGVGRLEDGRRVYFGVSRPPFGSFAEKTVTGVAMCVPLPDGLSDEAAAGLANPGMSSWAALTARAKFVAGESVLILGATGSAGRLAVQIAKRMGARRVVAAGRNPEALEKLKELGADVTISLELGHDELVAAFRREITGDGVDVVLDYLWGAPAEAVLAAIAQKGLSRTAPRIRFVQVGESAGKTISLAGGTLRSSGVELLGSGFGSASMEQIFVAIGEMFKEAAKRPFVNRVKTAALHDVGELWTVKEEGVRLVFRP
ncbi:MAG TPA: zinc-binding alcohol dehydrogenase family protein [Edaphobacter sp.]|jgi:NADPH:quinone reductase-like Zn-dependent oxidoreductase|nr:zinc-binding alcohol dehydrogenase family protein [Edaphobacter sp.]